MDMTPDEPKKQVKNVADLASRREKKAAKEAKKSLIDHVAGADRLGRSVLTRIVCNILDHGTDLQFKKLFPHRFRTFQPIKGERICLEIGADNVCEVVPAKHIAQQLMVYFHDPAIMDAWPKDFPMPFKQMLELVETWESRALPLVEEPKSCLWRNDPPELFSYNRLPWDFNPSPQLVVEEAPTWHGLLSRMTNAEAFTHWIGSLFSPDATHHQYLWMFGQGEEGKGSIGRFLHQVFGRAASYRQPPHPGERFWNSGLVGKKLIIFADCNNKRFPASGLFKQMTGGDGIEVEYKGKNAFTYLPQCRYIFLSNFKPELSSTTADMRRIILCEFTRREVPTADFERKLFAEGGTFLSHCITAYQQHYPEHGSIKADTEGIEDHVSVCEEDYEAILEKHFDVTGVKTDQISPTNLQNRLAFDLQVGERKKFIDWLLKKEAVTRTKVKVDGKVVRRYVGLKQRVQGIFGDVENMSSNDINVLRVR